jgi:hypothetical protein
MEPVNALRVEVPQQEIAHDGYSVREESPRCPPPIGSAVEGFTRRTPPPVYRTERRLLKSRFAVRTISRDSGRKRMRSFNARSKLMKADSSPCSSNRIRTFPGIFRIIDGDRPAD